MPAKRPTNTARRPGSAEDAHFRIDEHERRLAQLEQGQNPAHVAGVLQGAMHGINASVQAQLDKVLANQVKDSDSDRAVVDAIHELIQELRQHRQALAGGQR
jgi:hypothetical protein